MRLPKIRDILHDRFLAATVEHLSPQPAVTVQPDEPVRSVVDAMQRQNIGSVLVVDKHGALVGIFTERDVIKKVALQENKVMPRPIKELMTANPRCVRSSVSVARALYEMVTGGFRHLAVQCPSTPQLKMISSKGFVDFVHAHLTKRIAADPLLQIVHDSSVDQFFVSDISSLEPDKPVMLHEKEPLISGIRRLQQKNIGGVLIVNAGQKLVGIFTERDYLHRVALSDLPFEGRSMGEFMTTTPQTVLASSSVSIAFNYLSQGGYRHLPVVDSGEKLIGVLTVRNFMRYLSREIMSELSTS
ncbi:MAG: CBS domain-containing protein [Oligoflexia bacterium]|nr:CBS domain-containing protein [Oligoflexia bacterium]